MYWIKKKRKYDPTPYSRFLRAWHKIIGHPVERGDMHIEGYFNSIKTRHISFVCDCGSAFTWEGKE